MTSFSVFGLFSQFTGNSSKKRGQRNASWLTGWLAAMGEQVEKQFICSRPARQPGRQASEAKPRPVVNVAQLAF